MCPSLRPNLAVWDVASGREAKRMLQSRWPALLWSADEAVCVRMTNGQAPGGGGRQYPRPMRRPLRWVLLTPKITLPSFPPLRAL